MILLLRFMLSGTFTSCFYDLCLRFLLKKEKNSEEKAEMDTPAMPTTPITMETTPSSSPQPDPAPSVPEMSATDVPSPDKPAETPTVPSSATSTTTLPVQQEDAPHPQDAVRPKNPPTGSQTPEDDGEKAGPSGLNCHPSSPTSSAPFIPFSGGGQRLGGPAGGVARSLSSSSSSSLSALTAAVESPKAKKAKSNHGSSTKVSQTLSLLGLPGVCTRYFLLLASVSSWPLCCH